MLPKPFMILPGEDPLGRSTRKNGGLREGQTVLVTSRVSNGFVMVQGVADCVVVVTNRSAEESLVTGLRIKQSERHRR